MRFQIAIVYELLFSYMEKAIQTVVLKSSYESDVEALAEQAPKLFEYFFHILLRALFFIVYKIKKIRSQYLLHRCHDNGVK